MKTLIFTFILLFNGVFTTQSSESIPLKSKLTVPDSKVLTFALIECGPGKTKKSNLKSLRDDGKYISYGNSFANPVVEWAEIISFEAEITTPSTKGTKSYSFKGSHLTTEVKNILSKCYSGPVTIVFKKIVIYNAAKKPKTLEGKFTYVFDK